MNNQTTLNTLKTYHTKYKKQISNKNSIWWHEFATKALTSILKKRYKGQNVHIEVSRPTGLSSHFSADVWLKDIGRIHSYGVFSCGYVSKAFDQPKKASTGLYLRNFKVNTGKYRKGTIGEINGMNNPIIDVDECKNDGEFWGLIENYGFTDYPADDKGRINWDEVEKK